ncbi:hypothetical protein JCGZ_19407 [Jatropha curcas]|uniref:Polygalacturonase n=1 Tax=Jatropha curcas TaxID=180498 RepID=A0A067JZL5_JATCU|nr:hypothetical protein JCGZ_19407 [Jatropha curcas]
MAQVLTVTILSFFWIVTASSSFNVLDYGAIGDGKTDNSQAVLRAWEDLCGATRGTPTLIVPAGGTFLLKPVRFQGPCKSKNLHIQIQGTIVASNNINAWGKDKGSWLQFSDVNGLIIDGGGQIDGQGGLWWKFCKEDKGCSRPTALSFHNCNGLQLSGLKHLNSQRNHISINGCSDVNLFHLYITAPQDSPNTDGIDISASTHINIRNSVIRTGDDCIAINGFSSYINISGISCGPGHGISVGSLGKNGAYETVEEVHVQNCTFKGTQNGVRIKTWQGGAGYARKITFDNIILIASQNPIIIDQNYFCRFPYSAESSNVYISDVTYRNIRGSSSVERAIDLNCGRKRGCTNIVMDDIEIVPSSPGMHLHAFCNNAYGISTLASPTVPCLSNKFLDFFP